MKKRKEVICRVSCSVRDFCSVVGLFKNKDIINHQGKQKILTVGVKTGGVEVITRIFQDLDENVPAIIVAQHMPEDFTRAFAERMDQISKLHVKEAEKDPSTSRSARSRKPYITEKAKPKGIKI